MRDIGHGILHGLVAAAILLTFAAWAPAQTVPASEVTTTVEAFSDDPQHWAPVNEQRYASIIGRLRAHPTREWWGEAVRLELADSIDALALSADDPAPGPGSQTIVMAVDQLRRIANGLRARQSFSPPQLANALAGYVQGAASPRGPPPPGGIETLERSATAGPTPNESYLAKQMQRRIAACMAPMVWELSRGAPNTTSVDSATHTPSGWRKDNQIFRYRGTVSGHPYTGAYVKFSNPRYDPQQSDLNYGPARIAQDVEDPSPGKTKLIKNDSDAPVDVQYSESESLTDSFSTSVTHGLTMDLSVDSTQTVSGGYAGVSAEVSMQEHFGVSRTQEETHEQSQEGTHEASIDVSFTAAPGEYYLVTISKEHAVSYQTFRIDGVMDFDTEIGWGSDTSRGGHRVHRPDGPVHLQGIAGFQQFWLGYDTNYPQMQGFADVAYSTTRNGVACVVDPATRRITVAGTNQSKIEKNATYDVESLGHSVPPHLAHLPVEDAGDVTGGGQ